MDFGNRNITFNLTGILYVGKTWDSLQALLWGIRHCRY